MINSGRIELFQINPQMSGFEHNLPLTNDYTRAIEELPLHSHKRDVASFQCFDQEESCDPQFLLGGEDEHWHYPLDWEYLAIEKSQLPNYLPLQNMGTQAYLGILGYSSGHLIIPPFKFPVDAKSIRFTQQYRFKKFPNPYTQQSFSLNDQNTQLRFVNGDQYYTRYLADDQDRIYFAPDHFSLARIPKYTDFQLLTQS
ncbi:MAG: hypothetical protein Q4B28_05585 [bacterium]|nr:hypothetical protein [bacterium]